MKYEVMEDDKLPPVVVSFDVPSDYDNELRSLCIMLQAVKTLTKDESRRILNYLLARIEVL